MSERIRGALRNALYKYTYTLLYFTWVQSTLDPNNETFQCASPGRARELEGVCGVCTAHRVKEE